MSKLLLDLLAAGKEQGLGQVALARKAGIHPVTLSRAVSSGNCTLSTVEALAATLGMKIIVVRDNSLSEGLAKGDLF
jgi:DNA-binding phage protein